MNLGGTKPIEGHILGRNASVGRCARRHGRARRGERGREEREKQEEREEREELEGPEISVNRGERQREEKGTRRGGCGRRLRTRLRSLAALILGAFGERQPAAGGSSTAIHKVAERVGSTTHVDAETRPPSLAASSLTHTLLSLSLPVPSAPIRPHAQPLARSSASRSHPGSVWSTRVHQERATCRGWGRGEPGPGSWEGRRDDNVATSTR